MNHLDNLSGQTFGIWEVLEFDHMSQAGANGKHGMSHYKCKCAKCGRIFVLARSNLLQGRNVYHQGKCEED